MPGFTAATISFGGLVAALGVTSSNGINEKRTGIMFVTDTADLLTRTTTVSTAGPTGTWSEDWWSVWNYLQYKSGGCIVGGTGADFNSGSITVTNTPLHQTEHDFDVIFNSGVYTSAVAGGATSSARAAVSIATTRKDSFALIGAIDDIPASDVTSSYAGWATDFGIQSTDWTTSSAGVTAGNIIFIANFKKFIKNWDGTLLGGSSVGTTNLAADVAGCFARTAVGGNNWTVPAGINKGRILNVIALNTNYTAETIAGMQSIRVSPVVSLPGRGCFFYGNTTGAHPDKSNSNISFQSVLNYLRRELLDIGLSLLFEPNNANTRLSFTDRANNVLRIVKNSGSITAYNVICNDTNNSDATSSLVAKVIITPANAVESIVLTVVNGAVSEEYTI